MGLLRLILSCFLPVFGMVPFLNSILGTMLPMLGMAKQDHMKSVFCYGEAFAGPAGFRWVGGGFCFPPEDGVSSASRSRALAGSGEGH